MVFAIIAVIYHFIDQKKIMIIPFLYILVMSFFCNLNPFMTNILNGNNVLHPFAGDKKIDIINQNIPKLLLNKNRVERTAISLFSKTNNDFKNATFPDTLKIPFTFSKDELFEAIKNATYLIGNEYEFDDGLNDSATLGRY